MKKNEVYLYVGTDEFLAELRELGYQNNIQLDDFIDFLDEDPAYIEEMRPTFITFDEMSYVRRSLSKFMYNNLASSPIRKEDDK